MWKCAECGRELGPGQEACPECGATEARRRSVAPTAGRGRWLLAGAVLVLLAAAAYLVASYFAALPSPSAELIRHFRRGQELLRAGKHEAAIAELQTVVRMEPGSIAGHHELARAYAAAGRHAEALREMRQTLRLTILPAGRVAGTDQSAVSEMRQRARPPSVWREEAELRCELASLLARNDQFLEAVQELEKAARLAPALADRVDYQVALGIAHAGRGRQQAAEQALERAMELAPQVAREALAAWLANRPDGPETPLLQRVLAEGPATPVSSDH